MSFFFFYLFSYFIFIANICFFQIDRLEPSFTDSTFRFRFRIPDSGFRIPDSGFHVLVLPAKTKHIQGTQGQK